MSRKKSSKVSFNFTPQVAQRIFERDGQQCFFCRLGYHMECKSPMLLSIPDIMHFVNKSQNGLGIEENGVTGCRYHHGLLDNGHAGLRGEMLEMMEEYLRELYPEWDKTKLVYNKWDFLNFE